MECARRLQKPARIQASILLDHPNEHQSRSWGKGASQEPVGPGPSRRSWNTSKPSEPLLSSLRPRRADTCRAARAGNKKQENPRHFVAQAYGLRANFAEFKTSVQKITFHFLNEFERIRYIGWEAAPFTNMHIQVSSAQNARVVSCRMLEEDL